MSGQTISQGHSLLSSLPSPLYPSLHPSLPPPNPPPLPPPFSPSLPPPPPPLYTEGINDDRALGHLVVMSQYAWPKYSSLFLDVIKRIQRQGSFAYTSFCSYVVVVDILEEFAYLRTPEGGRITLDILPVATSSSSSSSGRSVTRGANRGAAEDFRTLIESQVYRTHEIDLDTVVKNFFAQEQNSLLQILEC